MLLMPQKNQTFFEDFVSERHYFSKCRPITLTGWQRPNYQFKF